MIQTGDLRIGNWFIGYDNRPFQWRYEHFAFLGREHDRVELDEIIKSGVLLTDEILSKCPCLNKGKNPAGQTDFHAMKSRWEIKWTIEHWEKSEYNEDCFFIYGLGTIKYLHELQNYYWIKEKKELEVDL